MRKTIRFESAAFDSNYNSTFIVRLDYTGFLSLLAIFSIKTMKFSCILMLLTKAVSAILSTQGRNIMELSAPKESAVEWDVMESINMHLFAMKQSSKYLVKDLKNNQFLMYAEEDELPFDKHLLKIWGKMDISCKSYYLCFCIFVK